MLLQIATSYFLNNWPIFHCIYIYYIIFILLSISGHRFFHILATVNNAAMNLGGWMYFQISVFIFSRYILRSGIAISFDRSMFRFIRNLHTVLHSDRTDVHAQPTVWKGSLFATSSLASVAHDLLMTVILTGVRWCLTVVLICISLMISDVEHFFMYLFIICVSSSQNVYSGLLPIFKSQVVCFFDNEIRDLFMYVGYQLLLVMSLLVNLLLLLEVTHFSKFLCYQVLLYDTFKSFIIVYFKPLI